MAQHLANRLAEYAVKLRFEDLPAAAVHEAKRRFIDSFATAVGAMDALLADATRAVAGRVTRDGRVSGDLIDREQRATHGLAWFATYTEALRQLAAYAERMSAAGSSSGLSWIHSRAAWSPRKTGERS